MHEAHAIGTHGRPPCALRTPSPPGASHIQTSNYWCESSRQSNLRYIIDWRKLHGVLLSLHRTANITHRRTRPQQSAETNDPQRVHEHREEEAALHREHKVCDRAAILPLRPLQSLGVRRGTKRLL